MKLLHISISLAVVFFVAITSATAEPTVSGSYRWEIAQGGRSVGLCGFSICSKPFGGVGQDTVNFTSTINDGRAAGNFQKAVGSATSYGNISISTSAGLGEINNTTLSLVKQSINGTAKIDEDYRIKIVGPPNGIRDSSGKPYESFSQLFEDKGETEIQRNGRRHDSIVDKL